MVKLEETMMSTISVRKHEHDAKEYIILTGTADEIISIRCDIIKALLGIMVGDLAPKFLFLGDKAIISAEEIWCINFNIDKE